MAQKLKNPAQSPQSLSFSILPCKPFGSDADRVGILVTLPYQEDIQKYKQYTNKDFVKKNNIDPALVKEAKEYLTRVSYFGKAHIYAHHENTEARHYRPILDDKNRDKLKENAKNYQDLARDVRFHDLHDYNEALIKVRDSSKIYLTAFCVEDVEDLLTKNAKEILPNSSEVKYTLFDPRRNIVQVASESLYHDAGRVGFTDKIYASKVKPKPLPAESRLEASVKHISSPAKAEEAPSFHLPPINQKPKLKAGNMKEESGHRLKNENHLPTLGAGKTDRSKHRDDSNTHHDSQTHLPKIGGRDRG